MRGAHRHMAPSALAVACMALAATAWPAACARAQQPAGAVPAASAAAEQRADPLADKALLARLTQGQMRRFRFTDRPALLPDVAAVDRDGALRSLADWRGRMVLLNVWASWCAPCREEMPALSRLQRRLADFGLTVVTLSIDKSPQDARAFLERLGQGDLPLLLDPQTQAATALGVRGAPTTILIDREGRELGRIEGAADWSADEAVLLVRAMLERSAPQAADEDSRPRR